MPTILITGANRGIGYALCESYLEDGWRVIGTARSPEAELPTGAELCVLDAANHDSIAQLAVQLKNIPLDVIWNNAGVYLDKNVDFDQLDTQTWLASFAINTVAPLQIAHALQDNLAQSTRKVLAFTTSKMGSLTHNGHKAYAYRSSKSALNMAVRCLANDLSKEKVSCLMLHPGHVKTDMGGEEGAIDTATSVAGMRTTVDAVNTETYPEYNSRYYDYDGSTIPW